MGQPGPAGQAGVLNCRQDKRPGSSAFCSSGFRVGCYGTNGCVANPDAGNGCTSASCSGSGETIAMCCSFN